jgi:hypothetical protein
MADSDTEPTAAPVADDDAGAGASGDVRPSGPPPTAKELGLTGMVAWPTWVRRLVFGSLLLAALAAAAWGLSKADTGEGEDRRDPAIVALFPTDGAQALRQTEVGADLAPGYDGRITVNGIEIPEEQMQGAVDPDEIDSQGAEDLSVRPNNRNRVYFKPGPGKVIEEFQQGTVEISVRYFPQDNPQDEKTISWSIRVD